ncbi:uncharacterized protein [Musca autumnalis]|uniref:uncharacterized protein n=1 Tax=Musca autumnalis TaxID=221902 RepID=UPI003CEE4492
MGTTDDMKTLLSRRDLLKGSIDRIMTFAKNPPDNPTAEQIETRLKRLEDIWLQFSEITTNLYKHQNNANYVDPSKEFHDCEDLYMDAKCLLNALIPKPTTQESNPIIDQQSDLIKQLVERLNNLETTSASSSIKSAPVSSSKTTKKQDDIFPNVVITPFTGEYKDWPSFEELYTSALKTKPNLANRQKMNYLKSLLRGTAYKIIQNMPSSDENYETAWKRLKDQFDRPLYIVHSYIEKFMNIPTMKRANEDDLRGIANVATDIIKALDSMNQSERDHWLIYILMSKLDSDICHNWLAQCQQEQKPNITDFLKFLDSSANDMADIKDYYKPSNSQYANKPHPVNGGKPLPFVHANKTSPAASVHSTKSEFKSRNQRYNNRSYRGRRNNGNRYGQAENKTDEINERRDQSPTASVHSTKSELKSGNQRYNRSYRGRRNNGNRYGQAENKTDTTGSNSVANANNINERKDQSQMSQGKGNHYNPFRANDQNSGNLNHGKTNASSNAGLFPVPVSGASAGGIATQPYFPLPLMPPMAGNLTMPNISFNRGILKQPSVPLIPSTTAAVATTKSNAISSPQQSAVTQYQLSVLMGNKANTVAVPKQTNVPSVATKENTGAVPKQSNVPSVANKENTGTVPKQTNAPPNSGQSLFMEFKTLQEAIQATLNQEKPKANEKIAQITSNATTTETDPQSATTKMDNSSQERGSEANGTVITTLDQITHQKNDDLVNKNTEISSLQTTTLNDKLDDTNPNAESDDNKEEDNEKEQDQDPTSLESPATPSPQLDPNLIMLLKAMDGKKGVQEIASDLASSNLTQHLETLRDILRHIEAKKETTPTRDYSIQSLD